VYIRIDCVATYCILSYDPHGPASNFPYEGRTRRGDRAGKTRTALLEMRTAPHKQCETILLLQSVFLKMSESKWNWNTIKIPKKYQIPNIKKIYIYIKYKIPNELREIIGPLKMTRNEAMLPRACPRSTTKMTKYVPAKAEENLHNSLHLARKY